MRGFSLVELLIAMALASLAIAGSLAAFAAVGGVWRDAGVQGRLHERAQYAFATLEPELQMAGYYGPGPTPALTNVGALPVAAAHCGLGVVTQLDRPVEVLRHSWPLTCPAQGGGALPGNDVLLTRRASIHPGLQVPGPMQIRGSLAQPELRGVFWPGHAAPPAAAVLPGTELRDLLVRIYYVSRHSDGDATTPALRVKSLTAIAGQPAFIDTEVMQGVEAMQVELLPEATAPQTVRVMLRVRPDTSDARPGATLPALAIHRRFSLRNAPLD